MFFVSINEKEGEHSNSLHNIFVFVNEIFNKNYINVSIVTNIKSEGDVFSTHISP